MIKIKLLVGLGAMVAVTALSAAPAGAWFKSLNGTSQGAVQATRTALVAGGAKVQCESAEGEWHLQTSGNWWEQQENGKQLKTTEGPHLRIKIAHWNNCEAEVAFVKVKGVVVSACEFQLEQAVKGVSKSTATVTTECVIKVPLKPECVISIPPGTHSGGNELLNEIKAANVGKTVAGTASVTGIHGKATCLKPEEFVKGEFTSGEGGIIAHELELV